MIKVNISKTSKYYLLLYLVSIIPFLLYLLPTDGIFNHDHTICLFKNIFGIECWGCGMTRAFFSLIYGNLDLALSYNKLIIIVFPMLVCYWIISLYRVQCTLCLILKYKNYEYKFTRF